ncbi:MAG: efflux RND transporter permease subunit [Thermodesulfobacteriota bacterium]|nr:MAG: efflux RND transporter permease subunit [Thermodesulfobacteriota bacterium]
MLGRIIEISVRNRLLVLLATAFLIGWGVYAVSKTPVDAIPDLSDVQVIIYTEHPGQAPQVVEDQVTYPLATAMMSVPKAKTVRGYSFFGVSFVYVIFEDGTDIYWARSRVLEYLNFASGKLPKGVTPSLGPDATGVGWVYEYTIEGKGYSLAELRSIQDWYIRYQLTSVPGVAEVASIGGFVKQYQVNVDPNRLLTYGVSIGEVAKAIEMSNRDVGGRVIEMAEREYMVRGLGYIEGVADIEDIVLKTDRTGTPVRIRDIARVELGPDERRGLAELNGKGEAVGGIVVMRFGENALDVIQGVKDKLRELEAGLPPGVEIRTAYDRSGLIHRAIDTLKEKIVEELVLVSLVCVVFLLHFRSSLVAIITLPIAVLASFIVMRLMGINANIMSLGGIAIAIGAMIDGAIVMIENAHKHIERGEGKGKDHWGMITEAAKEVGPALFFSLLIITVSFMPVFTLEAEEGRLFKPLAFTKTFAMAAAAFLTITLVPVLMGIFIKGRIRPEEKNPITKFLVWLYRPAVLKTLKYRKTAIFIALLALASAIYPMKRIGSEFMPPLNEGTLFYMPVTLPGVSVTKAQEMLQTQNRIIKGFPEVESVFGKSGRAMTATDPAPFEMFETIINLKPEREWRPGMTMERLIEELDEALRMPGVTNAWTMPIKARLDMLSTGIRTPVGVKVFGNDLSELERLSLEIEAALKEVPGTASAFAERALGGYYLDIRIKRGEAARYGLRVEDIQEVITSAVGGENVTTTVEGLERYPVNVRYKRELRDDIVKIGRVLVPAEGGQHVPLSQVALIEVRKGPAAVRTENALLTNWIFVDVRGRDIGGFVQDAKAAISENIEFPPGYYAVWTGQYEYMERAYGKLKVIVPLTLGIIFLLLYLNFKSVTECLIILLAVPFSLIGAAWTLYLLDYNLSIGVAVGLLALAGLDAETGIIMLMYLKHAYEKRASEGRMNTREDLYEAIREGAVMRVRPKVMTASATIAGLLPIMWSAGTGADVMKRIAAPMVGGMVTAVLLELLVLPAIYALWKGRRLGGEVIPPGTGKPPS